MPAEPAPATLGPSSRYGHRPEIPPPPTPGPSESVDQTQAPPTPQPTRPCPVDDMPPFGNIAGPAAPSPAAADPVTAMPSPATAMPKTPGSEDRKPPLFGILGEVNDNSVSHPSPGAADPGRYGARYDYGPDSAPLGITAGPPAPSPKADPRRGPPDPTQLGMSSQGSTVFFGSRPGDTEQPPPDYWAGFPVFGGPH